MAEKTERQVAIDEAKRDRAGRTLDELTDEYNRLEERIARVLKRTERVVAPRALQMEALREMIIRKIEGMSLDVVTVGGFNWEPKTEPKATVSNTRALVAHLVEKKMFDYLSVLPSKVQAVINEEAEENRLDIEVREEMIDGKPVEKQIIKSSTLPHVGVFLHEKLSRTKARKPTGGRAKKLQ